MGKKKAVAIREQIRTAFTAAGVDPILVLDAEIRTAKDKRKVSPAELASLAAVRDALAHVVESKPSRPVRRTRKQEKENGMKPRMPLDCPIAIAPGSQAGSLACCFLRPA